MGRPLRLRQLIQLEILRAVDDRRSESVDPPREPVRIEGVDASTTRGVIEEMREQGLLTAVGGENGRAGSSNGAARPTGLTDEGREYMRLLAGMHESAGGGTVAERTRESSSRGCPDDL